MDNISDNSYVLIDMQEILRVGGNLSSCGGYILFDNYHDAVNKPVSDMPLMGVPLMMQAYTLMVCKEGCLDYRLDYYHPITISGGEFIFFQNGQIIEFIGVKDNPKILFITVSKENMIDLLHYVPDECMPQSKPLKLSGELFDEIHFYYKMMRDYIDSSTLPAQKDVLRAYMFIILMRLGGKVNRQPLTGSVSDTSGVRKMEIYHRFVNEVKKHFKEHKDVEFYASSLCLSAAHLSRIIKAISGKTVRGWIRDYVILEAKVMLQTSNITISQISDSLNFPNPSFFSKYFREATGISPGQYRKSYKA